MMRFALLVSALALSGAAMAQVGFQPGLPNPIWTTVAEGNDCQIVKPETVILSNQGDWERHFRRMCGVTGNAPVNVPNIANWATEDVAIVHLGQMRTAGYRVYIETVVRSGAADLGIQWVTMTPPQGAQLAQMLTSPFCIVRIQRTAGFYRFFGRRMVNPYGVGGGQACACGCKGGCTCCTGGGAQGFYPGGRVPAWRFGQGGLTPLENGGQGGKGG
ncbi:MAG: protease complex subunit PrcB family protein [Armatimonadetes bacterium]|nr:protease complex subunit PrcB family protein [Armatimonadota bacterium]